MLVRSQSSHEIERRAGDLYVYNKQDLRKSPTSRARGSSLQPPPPPLPLGHTLARTGVQRFTISKIYVAGGWSEEGGVRAEAKRRTLVEFIRWHNGWTRLVWETRGGSSQGGEFFTRFRGILASWGLFILWRVVPYVERLKNCHVDLLCAFFSLSLSLSLSLSWPSRNVPLWFPSNCLRTTFSKNHHVELSSLVRRVFRWNVC